MKKIFVLVLLAGIVSFLFYSVKDVYFYDEEIEAEATHVLLSIVENQIFEDFDKGTLIDDNGMFKKYLGLRVRCGAPFYSRAKNILSDEGVRWQLEVECKFTKANVTIIAEAIKGADGWFMHKRIVSSDAFP